MSTLSRLIQALIGIGIGLAALFAFGQICAMPIWSPAAGNVSGKPAQATIVADRTECDFGEVPSGPVLKAEFEIRNAGGNRLILRKTNGDCDCLSSREANIIIEPGGRRTIIAELDTNREAGPVKIGLHYRTNDPCRPRLTLFCLAKVVSP